MNRSCWFGITLSLTTAISHADQPPTHVPAPVEDQRRIDTTAQNPESNPAPLPERETQPAPASQQLERFVPKERIPADSAISFPSDI